jgi:CDP-diacylglycerol--serine O-phosphatidyltransferase
MPRRRIHLLPNLITLGNAFCGLLALAKAIDALALSGDDPVVFYEKMETACFLVFLGMIFDSLDGLVARLVKSESAFGAQLDSFSDALTFGVVPAMLAKVLIEHEAAVTHSVGNARLHFVAAAVFALMAILRLVRYNLEPDEPEEGEEKRPGFRGLPSPAAAGAVASTIWLYLILRHPELERTEGTPTPTRRLLGWMEGVEWAPLLDWVPTLLVAMLPIVGLLMVSNVRYLHVVSYVSGKGQFLSLVGLVMIVVMFFIAPVPFLFIFFTGFTLSGLVHQVLIWGRGRRQGA